MKLNNMKRFILITVVLTLVLITKLNAQEPKAGDYIKFPQHQKFEGVWGFRAENQSITIILKNIERVQLKGFDLYVDQIEGKFTFVKNNKTILSNENMIKGGISTKENPNELRAVFIDPAGQGGKVIFTFENMSELNVLTAEFTPFSNMGFKDNTPLRVPKKITLTRVKE